LQSTALRSRSGARYATTTTTANVFYATVHEIKRQGEQLNTIQSYLSWAYTGLSVGA